MVSQRKTRLRIRLCLLALAGLLSSSPPAYALQDSESEDVGSTKEQAVELSDPYGREWRGEHFQTWLSANRDVAPRTSAETVMPRRDRSSRK